MGLAGLGLLLPTAAAETAAEQSEKEDEAPAAGCEEAVLPGRAQGVPQGGGVEAGGGG